MKTEIPLYMKMDDIFVPIGTAEMNPTSETHVKIDAEFDTFPGERLGFSRIVHWDEFLTYTRALYPEGFVKMADEEDDVIKKFKIDDKVRISESRNIFFGKKGKIITVMPDHYRVIFLGIEGYSIFIEDELEKIDE